MKRPLSLLLICFLLASFGLSAQETAEKASLKVHQINGKEYYIHIVEAGNTLYAISRMYAVPIEVLKEENPRLTTELTIGDRLLIPLKEVKRKNLEETLDVDGNYLIHEVQRKNTLYSIAKEYNIEINDIIKTNPEVEDGLKKGMKLKIPVAKLKSERNQSEYVVPAAASPYVTHWVEAKETLYSLAKKYEVSIDSIKAVNNGLPGGLKVGQLINLPILKTYEDTSVVEKRFDSTALKPQYRIALLLPFYLNLMEEAKDTTLKYAEEINDALFHKSKYAVEFYQGFKMAVDSLTNNGMNIKLSVFDTSNDTAQVAEILKDSAVYQADLIVGPMYFDEFMMVADFAKKHRINIVSPVKQSNKILLGNSHVSKVVSSDPVLLSFLGKYMADSLRKENMVIVYPDHVKERRQVELVKNAYLKRLEKVTDSARIILPKEVLWDPKRSVELKAALDSTKENVLIVPSDQQAFVTQLVSMMSAEKDYAIRIIGMDSWSKFDNIEVAYLQNLNVHMVMPDYINHKKNEVLIFEKQFAKRYQMIPEKFSYLGYDVAWYYLNLLDRFGLNFELALRDYKSKLLSHKFNFFKTGFESGYENHSVFLVRYRDFELQQVY